MEWHYVKDGQDIGPIDEAELQRLVSSGQLPRDALVWRQGMEEWTSFEQALSLPIKQDAPPAVPAEAGESAPCAECGRPFPVEDMIDYGGVKVCAHCKPAFFQKIREGVVVGGARRYAGFWVRFGARFIDNLLLWVIGFGIGATLGALGLAILATISGFVINIAYETFFLGKFGQTPGKMALGLKVIRSDGSALTYGRGFGRYFGTVLSGLVLAIGYIMAAFDEEKRALHDHICDTRVIRVR